MVPFDFGGGFGIFFLVSTALSIAFTIGVIALIVVGIRWLIRQGAASNGGGRPGAIDDAAMATLRERFARGEIDATEFEERKRTLGG